MTWTDEENQAFEMNHRSWNERVEAHWVSPMYRKHREDLAAGRPCLSQATLEAVGDVKGKSLVHPQCHMGMETLSWSMLGADAVGLDYSQPAIDKANLLRDELGLDARFVCANVYDAAEAIGRTFDIAFVSIGAVCWLPDINGWGRVIGKLLRAGGRLYMNESHPFLDVFDDHPDDPGIAITYPYLDAGGIGFDCDGTYADPDAKFENTHGVSYVHPISAVVNALIAGGLVIDRLEESAGCVWPRFKAMKQVDDDHWELDDPVLRRLPNSYTVLAHKA